MHFYSYHQALEMISSGAMNRMNFLDFISNEITKWRSSQLRKNQLTAERYYLGFHDIQLKKRVTVSNGIPTVLQGVPNNKITDNQFSTLVDQKASYIVGRPVVCESKKEEIQKLLDKTFTEKFSTRLLNAVTYSIWGGISWIYVYFDDNGIPQFQIFKAHEILPFWNDARHTDLACAVRLYTVEGWEENIEKEWTKVEIFTADGVTRYVYDGSKLELDVDNPGGYYVKIEDTEYRYLNGRIPLIPIKFNMNEQTLLERVKSLQDAYNEINSTFIDRTQEDIHSSIFVLKNYDGQNLEEFRRNVAQLGVIKVRSIDGANSGGVDILRMEVNTENFESVLKALKKAIIENGRGYDAKDDRIGSNANQMNIKSMYMDIDLDANIQERMIRSALTDLVEFMCERNGIQYEPIRMTFNRDQIINSSEVIQNMISLGVRVSNRSMIRQLPFIDDPDEEMDRIKKEESESLPYPETF